MALRDDPWGQPSTVGGYVEHERNLDQNGDAHLYGAARVGDEEVIDGNADGTPACPAAMR